MGCGPLVKGKPTPITPYKGSWAEQVNKPKDAFRDPNPPQRHDGRL